MTNSLITIQSTVAGDHTSDYCNPTQHEYLCSDCGCGVYGAYAENGYCPNCAYGEFDEDPEGDPLDWQSCLGMDEAEYRAEYQDHLFYPNGQRIEERWDGDEPAHLEVCEDPDSLDWDGVYPWKPGINIPV